MNRILDAIAWTIVNCVLLCSTLLLLGLWKAVKWFFGDGVWQYALGLVLWFLLIRAVWWSFCRVSGDPVKYWSNMGMFE